MNNLEKDAENKNDIDVKCLAGVYAEIAVWFGYETAVEMHKRFGGQQVSFPIRFLDTEYVAQCIIDDYVKGISVGELARKYHYSDRRIRQIINRE